MNYPFRNALLAYLMGGDAAHFRDAMEALRENYPPFAWRSAMNFLGTHDTPRILTLLGVGSDGQDHDKDWRSAYRMTEGQYLLGRTKLMLGALVLFAFPGFPPRCTTETRPAWRALRTPSTAAPSPGAGRTRPCWIGTEPWAGPGRSWPPCAGGSWPGSGQRAGCSPSAAGGRGQEALAAVNAGREAAALEVPWPARDWMTGRNVAQGHRLVPPLTGWLLVPREKT